MGINICLFETKSCSQGSWLIRHAQALLKQVHSAIIYTGIYFWDLKFNITEPVTRDHLSQETTCLQPMGWSFKIGSTVCLNLDPDTLWSSPVWDMPLSVEQL